MVVKIPKLYRTKIVEIEVDGEIHEIEVRGYRPTDIEIAAKLQSLRNELPALYNRLKVFRDLQEKLIREAQKHSADEPITEEELEEKFIGDVLQIKDEDYTEEEIQELIESKEEVSRIQQEIEKYGSKLGQRGLKRFYLKDEPGYKEAESRNEGTDYINNFQDIEIDQDHLLEIAYVMIELSAPNEKLQNRLARKAAGKGKSKKKGRKPSKKH
jgi:hypothetical protein